MKVAELLALNARPETEEAYRWALPFDAAADEWWRQCPHGNAMLEVIAVLELPAWLQILACCNCVDTIGDLIPASLKKETTKALETFRRFALGKSSYERVQTAIENVQNRARETKLSAVEATAVATVVTPFSRSVEATARFAADARAIAQNPDALHGNYDTPGYKRSFDTANEACAHAIRAIIPDDLVQDLFAAYTPATG